MTVVPTANISERIENAFGAASRSTGTSFDYLVRTASRESSFDPQAQAKTSSATGLFQFIESTWLEMMKEAGPHLGFERYAQYIEKTGNGRYRVKDAEKREEILNLRKDPAASALMAGAYTRKNEGRLTSRLGRAPTSGELYMAHFLGARGAERLITAADADPQQDASKLFPRQARANRAIFFEANGAARSVADVRDQLTRQHDAGAAMIAKRSLDTVTSGEPPAPRVLMTAYADPAQANDRVDRGWRVAQSNAPFDVLFRTDPSVPRDPVGPTFWSAFVASPDLLPETRGENAPSVQDQSRSDRVARRLSNAAAVNSSGDAEDRSRSVRDDARQPLNLTEYLRFGAVRGPRNLLPPA